MVKLSDRQQAPRPVRSPRGFPPTVELEYALLDIVIDTDGERDVIDAVTSVGQHRRFRLRSFERAIAARGSCRHRALLTSLIAEINGGATSTLEVDGVRLVLRAHGLPTGRGQVRESQDGATVLRDRVLEPFGIVIEFDGRLGHSDPTGRLRDNRRDNFVARTGRVPLRYGWHGVHERACECAAEIAAILVARGWPGTPEACGAGCRLGR